MNSAKISKIATCAVTSTQAFPVLYVLVSLVCSRRKHCVCFHYEIPGALCLK